MPTTPRHRLLAAWVALVAALALALMPALSRALAHGGANQALVEICSAHGATLTVAAPDSGEVQSLAGQVLDHCAYCGLAADRHAPLPPVVANLVLLPVGVSMPAGFWHAPRGAFAWRSAQPRAPPSPRLSLRR